MNELNEPFTNIGPVIVGGGVIGTGFFSFRKIRDVHVAEMWMVRSSKSASWRTGKSAATCGAERARGRLSFHQHDQHDQHDQHRWQRDRGHPGLGGSVRHADLLLRDLTSAGEIVVHGDWQASNLAIGINAGTDGRFGTSDEAYSGSDLTGLLPSLGRLEIGGRIVGTADSANNFGIVAGRIGQLILEGRNRAVMSGAGNDDFALGTPGDIRSREIPRSAV